MKTRDLHFEMHIQKNLKNFPLFSNTTANIVFPKISFESRPWRLNWVSYKKKEFTGLEAK